MSENIVNLDGVYRRFGEFVAVDNISLAVKRGEIFAFLGPNGAGKTTTIKMLTTLLLPSGGKIELAGYDVAKQPNDVRSAFGIVFQDPSLDDELTAWENLELHGVLYGVPKDVRRQRMKELLEVVELADRCDEYVKNFSGGMKRRLEIARGLLHHPKILFLDEPTIGLDPQTRNHLWGYVRKLNQEEGITIFFTTHYMEEAEKMANQIAIIDHGHIVDQGTAAELRSHTDSNSLEEAFLKLTGRGVRSEEVGPQDRMRMHHRARQR